MKSLFSRFTSSPAPPQPASPAPRKPSDEEATQLLVQASAALDQLRVAAGGGQDFPLLNQATRLVQEVDQRVAAMRESASKMAWQSQVSELRAELQFVTNKMLSSQQHPGAAPAAQAQPPPSSPQPSYAATIAPQQPAQEAGDGVDLGGDDLFSGLDLALGAAEPGPVAAPPQPPAAHQGEGAEEAQPQEVLSGVNSGAPLDEGLFTSLSEPEPPLPMAPATAATPAVASQPPQQAAQSQPQSVPAAVSPAAAMAAPEVMRASAPQPAAYPPDASKWAEHGAGPAEGGGTMPVQGVRRKKVIRSRVGYARQGGGEANAPAPAPAFMTAAAAPIHQPPAAPVFAVPVPEPPRPASVASECGSPLQSEADSAAASAGAVGRASTAVGSRAATPSGSVSSAPSVPSLHAQAQAARPSSPGPAVAAGSDAAEADRLAGAGTQDQQRGAVQQGAGGLAERLRQGLNLRLELPARSAHRPAGSTGSADSTVAMRGVAAGSDGYESDESITSPEYRPPESRIIPPPPVPAVPVPAAALAAAAARVAAVASAASSSPSASPSFSPARSPSKKGSLAEQLAGIQRCLQQQAAELSALVAQQAQHERGAKADRQRLGVELSAVSAQLDELQDAESAAVEKEDFELAASLGAELDSVREQLGEVQRRLKGAEAEAQQAAAQRMQLLQRQADLWEQAAIQLSSLQDAQQDRIYQARVLAEKASQQASASATDAQERLSELRDRIAERQRVVAEQQASVNKKLAQATGALEEEREVEAQACAALEAEVEELRAMLAAKEAELAARQEGLAGVEAKIAGLSAKFEKSLALIEEDKRLVATYERELEEEEAAAAAAQEEAIAAQRAAQQQAASLEQQLEEALQAAQGIAAEAARLRARADAEQRIARLRADLQQAQVEAEGRVLEAEAASAGLRDRQGALAARRATLQHELGAAERRAASARLRVPELEAQKKAAAAVRDFKEAARLSAEAKEAAAEAEAAAQQIESLRAQLGGMAGEEQQLEQLVEEAEEAVEGARQQAAMAKWRSVKAAQAANQKQLQQAVEAEDFDEAEALQVELDGLASEGAILAGTYGFQEGDAADVADDVAAASPLAGEDRPSSAGLASSFSSRLEAISGRGTSESGGVFKLISSGSDLYSVGGPPSDAEADAFGPMPSEQPSLLPPPTWDQQQQQQQQQVAAEAGADSGAQADAAGGSVPLVELQAGAAGGPEATGEDSGGGGAEEEVEGLSLEGLSLTGSQLSLDAQGEGVGSSAAEATTLGEAMQLEGTATAASQEAVPTSPPSPTEAPASLGVEAEGSKSSGEAQGEAPVAACIARVEMVAQAAVPEALQQPEAAGEDILASGAEEKAAEAAGQQGLVLPQQSAVKYEEGLLHHSSDEEEEAEPGLIYPQGALPGAVAAAATAAAREADMDDLFSGLSLS